MEKFYTQIQSFEYKSPNIEKEFFYIGDLSLLQRKKIAIVGTRKPMQYSKIQTSILAKKLSKEYVIVSGGAIGIDAIAHSNANNNTIYVAPCGLDIIYPKVNEKLIKNIYKNSLAISEYKPSTSPRNYTFVQRNRIVVDLADIVIIVEADINSGSIRSFEWAKKYQKEVYVLAHRIGESEGTNYLLKNNLAKPIYDIDEFLKSINCNLNVQNNDEFIKFCKKSPILEEVLLKFGDLVYEYELDGEIKIENNRVVVL